MGRVDQARRSSESALRSCSEAPGHGPRRAGDGARPAPAVGWGRVRQTAATVDVRTQEAIEVLAVCLYHKEKHSADRQRGRSRASTASVPLRSRGMGRGRGWGAPAAKGWGASRGH